MNRIAHKRVTYCSGCDSFRFHDTACACASQHAPVCATLDSCIDCRVDRLHPVFAEILSAFNGR